MAYEIEKKSLEAHVEICAERYSSLETQFNNLVTRMDSLEGHIIEIKDSITKVGNDGNSKIITIGTTIFGVLLTAVLGILVHLATK
jgi:hypothetical protein